MVEQLRKSITALSLFALCAAAGGTVGLGKHDDNAVAGFQEPGEGARREGGSSRED